MHLTTLLVTLAVAGSTAVAGVTNVHNKCDFDVWVTSVGVTQSDTKKLAPRNYWNEKQFLEGPGVGTAIKITRTATGLYENKPVLHLSYSYNAGKNIFYDLSTHNGFDFWGEKLRVHGSEGKEVEQIVWDGEPKPNHTAAYNGETDLTLELCD
jgi:hypothetical protein